MTNTQYDLIIIGGGPAGCAGAVYAARKLLKTALIAESFGGQSIDSATIYNWIGTPEIPGIDLAKNLEKHVRAYEGEVLSVISGEKVVEITEGDGVFSVKTSSDKTLTTKTVLISSGSGRRKLAIPGADTFEHKGLTYCASCDGPLFAGQDVAVIGGGNAGFETAAQLLAYCKSVTLLHRGDSFRADEVTVNKVLAHPNMKALMNIETTEVIGEKFVTGISYKDTKTGEETTLPVTGIFVEIGQIPNTDFVKDFVTLDEIKKIVVDPMTQRTSRKGVWAAGDCTNGLYHQNNIAAGDAVKALEDLYLFIHAGK